MWIYLFREVFSAGFASGRGPEAFNGFDMQIRIAALSAVTLGVSKLVSGVMSAGVANMFLKKARGEEASIRDCFSLNGMFGSVFAAELVLVIFHLLPSIGSLVGIATMGNDQISG